MARFEFSSENQPEKSAGSPKKKVNEFRRQVEELDRKKAQEAQEAENRRKLDIAVQQDKIKKNLSDISDPQAMESQAFLAKVRERETRGFFRKHITDNTKWATTSKEAIIDQHKQFIEKRVNDILLRAKTQQSDVSDVTGYNYDTLKDCIKYAHDNIKYFCDKFKKKGVGIDKRRRMAHEIAVYSDYLQTMHERVKNVKYLRGTDFVDENKLGYAYRRFQEAFNYRYFLIIQEYSIESSYKTGNILYAITNIEQSTSDFAKEHHDALVKMERLMNDQKSEFSKEIEKFNGAARECNNLNAFLYRQTRDRNVAASDMQDERARYIEAVRGVIQFEKYLRSKIVSIKDEPDSISPDLMDAIGAFDYTNPTHWDQARSKQAETKQAETEPFLENPQLMVEWWNRQ